MNPSLNTQVVNSDVDASMLDDILSGLETADTTLQADAQQDDLLVEFGDDAALEAAIEAAADVTVKSSAPAIVIDKLPKKGKRKAKLEGGKPKPQEPETSASDSESGDPVLGASTQEASDETPEPTKKPSVTRVTFAGNRKSAVLDNRLGGKTADMLILEVGDADLDPEELAAKQKAFREDLDSKIAKKVAEKIVMLLKDLQAGNTVKNEVMRTAFEILKRDGQLVSGDKGNLQQALGRKYSIGTARSQSNQIFTLMPALKITTKNKSTMVPNPQSTIYATLCGAA